LTTAFAPDYRTEQFKMHQYNSELLRRIRMERYQGKKVVIIGGTSGMGLATAKLLIDGGARVLVTGLSRAGLESAEKEIGKHAIVLASDARS
jgi:NADPH:quinone reductase-like Zn-dependent oxidoreductase